MSIRMDETIVGVWFASLSKDSDWMMGINRTDEGWLMQYRFRYYGDDSGDPWSDKDKKNWYASKAPKDKITEEELIKKMGEMYELIKLRAEGDCYALLRGAGSFEDFIKEFQKLPFVHARVATDEERAEVENRDMVGTVPPS